ncbi:MAG TPA: twin-arginine translocase TatA/TatE family subunit [Acidimicrobiales bacterium]|nr:twin-arginine translocase TatA/TatE family subunit [Acidimicrobiales bacterium]
MLNLGPEKVLFVLVIALVVLGPNRLPQAARTLGRMVANLRRLSSSLQAEVQSAMSEPADALRGTAATMGLGEIRQTLREVANPLALPRPGPGPGGEPAISGGVGVVPAAGGDPPVGVPGTLPTDHVGIPGPPPPDDPSLN